MKTPRTMNIPKSLSVIKSIGEDTRKKAPPKPKTKPGLGAIPVSKEQLEMYKKFVSNRNKKTK